MNLPIRDRLGRGVAIALVAAAGIFAAPQGGVSAQGTVTPFMSAIAEGAALDPELAAFYRESMYEPVWTGEGPEFAARRAALLMALSRSGDHALPVDSYNVDGLEVMMRNVRTQRDLGRVEVALSKTFLKYAHDLSHVTLEEQQAAEQHGRGGE